MKMTNKKPANRLYYVGYNFMGFNRSFEKNNGWTVLVFTTKKEADDFEKEYEKAIRIRKSDVVKILGKETMNTEYKYIDCVNAYIQDGYTEMIRETF